MKCRHDGFQSRHLRLFVRINWYSSAVICNSHTVFRKQSDFNVISKTTHSFIPGVVKNLCDEVMKSVWSSSSDIHSGSFPDRLQPLQNLNGIGAIMVPRAVSGVFLFTLIFILIFSHFFRNKKEKASYLRHLKYTRNRP